MSIAARTFGLLAIALVGLVVYLSTFVLGFHVLFYVGLVLTPVMLGVLVVLTTGRFEDA